MLDGKIEDAKAIVGALTCGSISASIAYELL